ncbi:cytochrome P450 [Mycolicibacterium pulveris]|uniref:Steroid C26-monooxygenase n=1 Tax=Mycolicibacterium pulveris TaxID=36813 RepID=A0A7I7UH96_MYCPV|nr:cytochrome P450 [Mycolicibacterium pulveris]MCV6981603.1 cytochrome P450 [Mycolicibacterium pulveris]BBY80241.1 steroid C26-monooxygenase [Mycolicibacterium pulveris]
MTVTQPEIRVLDAETYANGDPATFGLPLDQYAWLRDNEPCYLQEFDDPMLIDRAWVVSRNADIWAVDRNAELYSTARGGVNIWRVTPLDAEAGGKPAMLTMDGAKHREQRGVMSKAFTPGMVRKLEEKFREYARKIVDAALEEGTFDFVTGVGNAMPMEALGDVLGVPAADRPKFFGWVDTFAAPFDTRITPSFEHVFNAIMSLFGYAVELGDLKRKAPGDDVITQLVQAGTDVISEDELMGNVALLASGAAESTRTALSHGLHALIRHPDQMAWLRERADDIPDTAIQEIIRIATPFTHLVRTATADHELHGKEIKENDKVLMLFAAGNFDERAFDNPNEFDLSRPREKNPHVSFGRGPHQCLGKHVATLEMKILLEELLQRTSDIKLAGEILYVRDAYSRGVYQLPVTITAA